MSSQGQPKVIFGIGLKIFLNLGLSLCVIALVAMAGYYHLSRIGERLAGIAERDMPVIQGLTAVALRQLDQAVLFERSLGAGEVMGLHPRAVERFEYSVQAFNDLNPVIDGHFEQVSHLAGEALAEISHAEEAEIFARIAELLSELAIEHGTYVELATDIFRSLEAGNVGGALAKLPAVEAAEEHLVHTLETMLTNIESFTLTAASEAEAMEQAAITQFTMLGIGGLALTLLVGTYLVTFVIVRPLKAIVAALKSLTGGDTSKNAKVRANDEIGSIAWAYGQLRDTLVRKEAEKKKAILDVADRFESTIGEIVNAVSAASTELNVTSQSVSQVSEATKDQASTVAAASEQASANVQMVAAATEEMTRSIDDINNQVNNASTEVSRAVVEVEKTSGQMTALSATAEKIGQVISMISEIAEQTNLLALNATIESARAGDAGKGFSVVAGEVKQLANRSGRATGEIAAHIQEIQAASTQAVASMGTIGSVIQSVSESSSAIASAMEQQRAATKDIARNVQEAASGTQSVSTSITQVSEGSREAGAASSDLSVAAGELSRQSENLANEVNTFLTGLREGAADRRNGQDPKYNGPERRASAQAGAQNNAAAAAAA